MNVTLNGEQTALPDNVTTIYDLVEHYHLSNKIIIVEHNQTIIEKQAYQNRVIHENDIIEVVNFVGGG